MNMNIPVVSAAKGPEGNFFFKPILDAQENSIFFAPAHIRSGKESDFEPKLVSIGPYYQELEKFKPMEELKLWCESDLLKMRPVGGSNIDSVPVELFERFQDDACSFYNRKPEKVHIDEITLSADHLYFVRMLVLDSCFIIRIILSPPKELVDSLSNLGGSIELVRSDMLLLENQIPLFFIERVYNWLFPPTHNPRFPSFETVLEQFISLDIPWRINRGGMSGKAAHLLDLYWRCSSSPRHCSQLKKPKTLNSFGLIENAAELHHMAGIKFKILNDKGNHNGLDVIFSHGIIRMPFLKIDSSQITLLLNLIAFESSKLPGMGTFSSYMKLLGALITSEKDVKLLHQNGVIKNSLSSHKKAVSFFNEIGNCCLEDYNTNLFSDLYENVHEYCYSRWNRARWASLRHDYFSSPWVAISVVGAVTLLILAILQTIYTILAYYK